MTPINNHYGAFNFQIQEKAVEGPRGPHLFRVSQDSTQNMGFHLSMSPLTPKEPMSQADMLADAPPMPVNEHTHRSLNNLTMAVAELDTAEVYNWTPAQVAAWMYDAGFEDSVVDKFKDNDISGAILVDLKFEDLKELDIQSFGKRHRVWTEIHHLRGSPITSPTDSEVRPFFGERSRSIQQRRGDCGSDDEVKAAPRRAQSSRRAHRPHANHSAFISPAESVSIVGIEQLIPKPHRCSKGERCAKWRRQQRQLAFLNREHPISPSGGGQVYISGNPGNAATAEDMLRPTSEAVPSVVASSDVLGPSELVGFQLGEDSLRALQQRDPQENVKHYLSFQHVPSQSAEEPATPPLDLFPALNSPLTPRGPMQMQDSLRYLPRLSIPQTTSAALIHHQTFSPIRSASAFSPRQVMNPSDGFRRGTPFSEMDVPVTVQDPGPIARDTSQSVPPDMRYRRESRIGPSPTSRPRQGPRLPSFAMTRVNEDTELDTIVSGVEAPSTQSALRGANHAGWMKKRKTKFLRHEWNEHHFVLRGTTLAMRQSEKSIDALEHIDVDDYAVACSSLNSSKISAALKSMKLSGKSKNADGTAFAFQLVPAAEKKGIRHAALGKTHHFAVRSRDQRIDWMRELMLAKALKQKNQGFEVTMNGNMI